MILTRGKEAQSKSESLPLVADEPVPLQVHNPEAADGPHCEGEKNETLNSEVVTVFGGWYEEEQTTNEMNDDGEEIGFEITDLIVDGNESVLTKLGKEDKLEVAVDGGDAATGVENSNERTDEEEPEEDEEPVNCGSDDEDGHIGELEKRADITACVANTNVGLAVSQHVPAEYLSESLNNDKQANEPSAKEPISTLADIGGHEPSKESAIIANEVEAVAEKLIPPRKKTIRKKLIKKKTLLGKVETSIKDAKVQPSDDVEGSGVACKASTSNEVKPQCFVDNEATGEASKEDVGDILMNEEMNLETGGDESIKESAIVANEVEVVAEQLIPPMKKIIRKKLIKKKTSPGKVDTAINDAKAQPSDDIEGSGVASKASRSNEVKPPCLVDNEATGEASKEDVGDILMNEEMNLEIGGDESIKESAIVANEVKAVAEKLIPPVKKIIRKKLIKKTTLLGKVETAINDAKPQPSDDIEGSGVACKASTSNEVKPQCLVENGATGEASKEGVSEIFKNEEKAEEKPLVKANRKLKRNRKVLPQGQSDVQIGSVEQKPLPTNNESVTASKENQTIEQEIKNEEAEKSKGRRHLRKRKNKKVVEEGTKKEDAMDIDKPASSKKGKLSRIDGMGMIFMCSSETKKDCYRYKVLGLPAGKKDIVSKIYKGMRLFLFDINLKMLYGIYKAAGPGSYNVEPRAFNSQFPSQVRFTVLEDCLPIAEEKFKKVIKDNYYTKNKFNGELTSEQVKSLCKLFHETTKKSDAIRGEQSQQAFVTLASTSSARGDRKRKRGEDSRRAKPGAVSSLERRRRTDRDEGRHAPMRRGEDDMRRAIVVRDHEDRRRAIAVRDHEDRRRAIAVRDHEDMRRAITVRDHEDMRRAIVARGQEETRLAPAVIDERYRHPVVVYDREAYLPPVASSPLYQPLQAEDTARTRIYTYEREPVVHTYRRDAPVEYRDRGALGSRETRRYAEEYLRDPYAASRERVYHEPVYDTETRTRQERYDHASTGVRYAEYYRSDNHQPPLPLHRRY